MKVYDTVIIGGGQAGLSVAYFLKRKAIDFVVLDDQDEPGGAWNQTWESLRLFSPVSYSSLPGWMMPKGPEEYPGKEAFIKYMAAYEARYALPILRQQRVLQVAKEEDLFRIDTNNGSYFSKTLVSATGSAQNPFIPEFSDRDLFQGIQIHSVQYKEPGAFAGKDVLIVGGGNSGAQILAEVSKVAHTKWITLKEPNFLPEEIDGRYLFNQATARFQAQRAGKTPEPAKSLSDIVRVPSVKEAIERGVYQSYRPFVGFYENGVYWPNGDQERVDAIIWCTGFKANLQHLASLKLIENGRISTQHTRSMKEPLLWLVGYGNWTGFASATIYGVQKTARSTALEILEALDK